MIIPLIIAAVIAYSEVPKYTTAQQVADAEAQGISTEETDSSNAIGSEQQLQMAKTILSVVHP